MTKEKEEMLVKLVYKLSQEGETSGDYEQDFHDFELIFWNESHYVQRIRAKMEKFKPLFADMRDINYNNVVVRSAPDHILSHNPNYSYKILKSTPDESKLSLGIEAIVKDVDNTIGGQENSIIINDKSEALYRIDISAKAMQRRPDITLLHEMIHLHERTMTASERKRLQDKLYTRLSDKIEYLDLILQEQGKLMQKYFSEQAKGHDALFFLKSLDIESHFKKYKPGTIGNYNFHTTIMRTQYQAAKAASARK